MTVCPEYDKIYNTIEYGRGAYLFDNQGNKYLDACSGKAAASCLGHGVEDICLKMYEQAQKLSVFPSHSFSAKIVEEYLVKLVDFAPKGFNKAWITTGGTESVENAIKLSLQYHHLNGSPDRFKVISRANSYHGNSFFTLDIGGMEYRKKIYGKGMFNYPHIPAANTYRKPNEMSLEEYSKACSEALESTILMEGPETISAFIFEPVVAAAMGAVPPPDQNYLSEIRRICTKYGVLLIADEVLTGFGRLGKNFGVELWGVVPDIIACGKGMSAGYFPIGGVLVHSGVSKIFEEQKTAFLSGSTFACNPVAAAVGLAVIDHLRRKDLVEHGRLMGELLMKKLQGLYKYSIVGDIRGAGLLIGLEFVKNKKSKESFPEEEKIALKILEECIGKGVIFYPGNGDVLLIMPPLTIGEEEVNLIYNTLDDVISGFTSHGF